MKQYAIGIDLGGTMIKYAIVSSDGEIIYQSSTLTPLDKRGQRHCRRFYRCGKSCH